MMTGLTDRASDLFPDSPAEPTRRGARDQRPCEPGGWLGDVLLGIGRSFGPGQTGFSNPVHGRAAVHLDPESIGGIQSGYLPDVLDAPPRDLLPRMVRSFRGCRPGHDLYVACRDDLASRSGDQRVASDRHAATWSI